MSFPPGVPSTWTPINMVLPAIGWRGFPSDLPCGRGQGNCCAEQLKDSTRLLLGSLFLLPLMTSQGKNLSTLSSTLLRASSQSRLLGSGCWVLSMFQHTIFPKFTYTDPERGKMTIFLQSQESHQKQCQLGRQELGTSPNKFASSPEGRCLTLCLQRVFQGNPLSLPMSLCPFSPSYPSTFPLQSFCPSQSDGPTHSLQNPNRPMCKRGPGHLPQCGICELSFFRWQKPHAFLSLVHHCSRRKQHDPGSLKWKGKQIHCGLTDDAE